MGKSWALFALIFLIEATQVSSVAGFHGYVHYYRSQWVINYSNGFVRRGLLGSLLRLLHLDTASLVIAACGWIVTFALFVLVVRALCRFLAPLEPLTRNVLLAALLLSPVTTGILVQTSGDPIQLILLVYIGLAVLFLKPGKSLAVAFLAFFVLGIVSVLVHEASIFFVGPVMFLAAFFVRRSRIDQVALLGYALSAIPAVFLVIHFTQNHAVDTKFSSLLAEENGLHFHRGITGYLIMLRNAVGALLLPFFFAFTLGRLLPQSQSARLRSRVFFAFMLPLFLSVPLWVIAHDWGRFSSYTFMLVGIVLSLNVSEARKSGVTTDSPTLPVLVMGILLFLSGLTTAVPEGTYVIKGVGADNYTLMVAVLLCSIAIWSLNRDEYSDEARLLLSPRAL